MFPRNGRELENVFVKHYAPNRMLAAKDNKDINKCYGICPKADQVIYALDTICMPDSSRGAPIILFTRLLYYV